MTKPDRSGRHRAAHCWQTCRRSPLKYNPAGLPGRLPTGEALFAARKLDICPSLCYCSVSPPRHGARQRMADQSAARTGTISRKTNETEISVTVNLDGTGKSRISTGVGFFDHMLDQLSRHSLIDMDIETKGDLHIHD